MCKTAEGVRALVKQGAKVDVTRGDGATALIVHTEAGNKEVVQELINWDANVDLQDTVSTNYMCNVNPLHPQPIINPWNAN